LRSRTVVAGAIAGITSTAWSPARTIRYKFFFPGGSSAAVEKLYRNSPAARAVNTLAAEAVKKLWSGCLMGGW